MANIGKISVVLAADASGLVMPVEQAGHSLDKLKEKAEALKQEGGGFDLGKALGIGVGAAGGFAIGEAATEGIRKIIDSVKEGRQSVLELSRESDRLGVSMRSAAAFEVLAGDRAEMFNRALAKLSEGLGSVRAGSDEYVKKLAVLGIDAQKLANLPLDKAYQVVADKLAKLTSGTDRAYAAHELFGKSSEHVLDIIQRGGGAFETAAGKVDQYRLAVSKINAQTIREQEKKVKDLKLAWEGFKRQLAVKTSPVAGFFTDTLKNFLETGTPAPIKRDISPAQQQWLDNLPKIAKATDTMALQAQKAEKAQKPVAEAVEETSAALDKQIATLLGDAQAAEVAALRQRALEEALKQVAAQGINGPLAKNLAGQQADQAVAAAQEKLGQAETLKGILTRDFGGVPEIFQKFDLQVRALDDALKNNKITFEQHGAAVADLKQKLDAAATSAGWKVFGETRTPLEQAGERFRFLDQLLKEGKIDADLFARSAGKIGDELLKAASAGHHLALPSSASRGTQEAEDFVAQQMSFARGFKPPTDVKEAIEALKRTADEQLDELKKIADDLQNTKIADF